jgi:hypothetical protein
MDPGEHKSHLKRHVDVADVARKSSSPSRVRMAHKTAQYERLATDFLDPLHNFVEFKFQHLEHAQKKVRRSVRDYRAQMEAFEKSNANTREKLDPAKFLQVPLGCAALFVWWIDAMGTAGEGFVTPEGCD